MSIQEVIYPSMYTGQFTVQVFSAACGSTRAPFLGMHCLDAGISPSWRKVSPFQAPFLFNSRYVRIVCVLFTSCQFFKFIFMVDVL